jgi:uncharacterized SAM-binding protein YcdF (DUF218 family)
MFQLSKLLPLLVLPLGLALLLLLFGVLRPSQWPARAALVILWLFATPLTAELLWRSLEWPHRRQTAAAVLVAAGGKGEGPGTAGASLPLAAVVVLGGGRHPAPGPARVSEWVDADRFFAGIEAYQQLRQQGRRPLLFFTGGWWPSMPELPPEGDVLRRQALAFGLPPADLRSTARVRNTAEEAREIAAQLPAGSAVVLVTSAFHMARAQRLFERRGLRVVPFPVDFQATGRWAGSPLRDPLRYVPSSGGLDSSSRALREWIGRLVYGIR